MLGAIIGDIVGSRFEFDRGNKSRDFVLFASGCEFTDDTVMTVAVAEALLNSGINGDEKTIKSNLIKAMKKWGQRYPGAGYGARFVDWVLSDDPRPYGSFGNGSGMRVSPVGWLYKTIERTREVARWTAEISHNHPEGIKGAESVAAAIFMARTKTPLSDIRNYIESEFQYDLSKSLDDIRPNYHHVEDCMHTMPEAFECFLEANSYEETLRNVMYIGGDTDTLCAIAGSIAEAYWGIPQEIMEKAQEYISKDISDVIIRFTQITHSAIERFVADGSSTVNSPKTNVDSVVLEDVNNSDKFAEILSVEKELQSNSNYAEIKNPILESIKRHKGTAEDPIPWPYIAYSDSVKKLMSAVYNFHKNNPDYHLQDYMSVLNSYGYTDINVNTIDVSDMDDKCLMALFMALVRGERFHDGLILQALESGAVQKWLEHLKEIIS